MVSMAADSDRDTSRTVVKTYLPAYQREEWDEHADQLDMTRSEFVKTMVQAGRRGFEGVEHGGGAPGEQQAPDNDDADGDSPTGPDLREAVLEALSEDGFKSWDGLLESVTGDIESQLEAVLEDLQAENRVRYSGRNGGYTREK